MIVAAKRTQSAQVFLTLNCKPAQMPGHARSIHSAKRTQFPRCKTNPISS